MIDEYALAVFTGYVACKMKTTKTAKNCAECFQLLTSKTESSSNINSFLELKSCVGLLKPSNELYNIVMQVHILLLNIYLLLNIPN